MKKIWNLCVTVIACATIAILLSILYGVANFLPAGPGQMALRMLLGI